MSRSKVFFINGGAGRVVCSIPAFEMYEKENPDDDFIIVCEGGTDFFKGHPTLHDRVYDVWHKGLFEQFIKDRDCISPEPYRIWEYYNQKCNLTQAFDIEINKKGIRDLPAPKIVLNKMEMVNGAGIVEEVKSVSGFDKALVVQPFGRGVENVGGFIVDPTSRSFQLNNIIEIINVLKKEYAIIIMSELPVDLGDQNPQNPVAQPQIPDMRIWSGVINAADHFLGCDSLGQHIVKALGKTATVVCGSTYPINISYPGDPDFDIVDVGEGRKIYSPIRLTIDEQRDRANDEVMEMTKSQIDAVISSVRKRLGKSNKIVGRPMQESGCCPTPTTKPTLIPGSSNLKTSQISEKNK
jgi:hypothetical protein